MKKIFMASALFLSLFLVACSGNNVSEESGTKEMSEAELKQLVNDYSERKKTSQAASISSTELVITDNDKEHVYDLPKEEFFVSIAPFINETHPCDIHSLTGCQGELVDEDFQFHIKDQDGNVVLNETKNSGENGFVDLWLPRDQTYEITITQDEKQVQSELSTFEDDGTCVTTMQLM